MTRGTFPTKGKHLQSLTRVVAVAPDGTEIASVRGTIVTPHGDRGEWRVRVTQGHQWGVSTSVVRPSEEAARQWAEASTSVGARWMGGILVALDRSKVAVRRVDPTVEYRLEVARARKQIRQGFLEDQDLIPVVHGLIRVGPFVMKPRREVRGVSEGPSGRVSGSWKTLVQVFFTKHRDPTLRSLTERSSFYQLSEEEAEALSDGVSPSTAVKFVVRVCGSSVGE